jgi:hypothetical protein
MAAVKQDGVAADDDGEALEARLRHELGAGAANVPPPPPPARPPRGLGLLRARISVRVWRFRAGVPESMKRPFRRLLRRPAPAELAEPDAPSDLVRALEDLQFGQAELARRLTELEEQTALERRGKRRAETPPPAKP